jgi:hypothetical protein
MPQDQVFESALSLPQQLRADLAFQLLRTLCPEGEEITSDDFGADLRRRIAAHRQGQLDSYSLDEARAIIAQQLMQDRPS